MGNLLGSKIRNTQFFTHFTLQSLLYAFSQIYVSAYGRIPFPRLYVFPFGTLLQIEFATRVEHMQMHHGMQQLAPIVALTARSGSYDIPFFIHHRKHFLIVVLIHKPKTFRNYNFTVSATTNPHNSGSENHEPRHNRKWYANHPAQKPRLIKEAYS